MPLMQLNLTKKQQGYAGTGISMTFDEEYPCDQIEREVNTV
jgi:hypothetical protein